MYDEIPFGGTLFTIDKIGLRIETKYLNKTNIKPWLKGNCINIMMFGNIAQINVHAEFEPFQKHSGKRCLDAILVLIINGVFNTQFSIIFYKMFFNLFPFIVFDKSFSVFLLSNFFTLSEWEWAIDFLDIYPFSSIKTDLNNPKSLRKKETTFYSKDWKKTRRTKKENGLEYSEVKGVQKSFLSSYDKGKKIESERPIFRTEIRQQGKHRKDLTLKLLDGTAEEAFSNALPILKKNINKIIEKDTFSLDGYWKSNTPDQYKQLFLDND
jgi:hypothetical protein